MLDLALSVYFAHIATLNKPEFQVTQPGELVIMLGRRGLPENYTPSHSPGYHLLLVGEPEGVRNPDRVAQFGQQSGVSSPYVFYASLRKIDSEHVIVYFGYALPAETGSGAGHLVNLYKVNGIWLVRAIGWWIV